MMISEAIRKIEALFTVHDEAGSPVDYEDSNGKFVADGPRNMALAPCGKKYAVVTSFGVDADLPEDAFVMFGTSGLALQWWYDEVREYARSIETDEDKWSSLHLYWRLKPVYHSTTYLAMDQGSLLRTQSPLARILQIDLGFVESQMLITKLGPDGKEG